MSDLSGTAAVGIESVEWLDAGGGNLTVRVTGRWRRRRPAPSGQTALVIETEGRRQRFPATPEPPSLAGTAPGTWRLTFSVPGSLAPDLGGHAWLSFGTVAVPLPVPESAAGSEHPADPGGAPGADPGPPVELTAVSVTPAEAGEPREAGAVEPGLEIERAWRRAEQAEQASAQLVERVAELEGTLRSVRDEHARSVMAGAEGDRLRFERGLRDRRVAGERRVPAEPAGSAAERAPSIAEPARPSVAAAPPGVAEPARPALAADLAPDELAPPPLELTGAPGAPVSAPPDRPPPDAELVRALRTELKARATAEAGLRARVVQAEARLAARVLMEQRTNDALRQLRDELQRLRDALEDERARRHDAEGRVTELTTELGGQRDRSRDAYAAIGELRAALERLRPSEPPSAEPPSAEPPPTAERALAGGVTPERLSDALSRLRETTAPRDEVGEEEPAPAPSVPAIVVGATPAAAGRPTLASAFRRLARRDPDVAGRFALDLLALQRVAYPHPISYDLLLGPGRGCVQVTVGGEGPPVVGLHGAARAREQVDLQIVGPPARLARLLIAGPLRRLLRIGLARVRGRREGLVALDALLALPLDLAELRDGGLRVVPETLLGLIAAAIDPAWTRGERFTIALLGSEPVYLSVRDGASLEVTRTPPHGRVATEIRCEPSALVGVLTEDGGDAPVSGDSGPLHLLRTWLKRAQSG